MSFSHVHRNKFLGFALMVLALGFSEAEAQNSKDCMSNYDPSHQVAQMFKGRLLGSWSMDQNGLSPLAGQPGPNAAQLNFVADPRTKALAVEIVVLTPDQKAELLKSNPKLSSDKLDLFLKNGVIQLELRGCGPPNGPLNVSLLGLFPGGIKIEGNLIITKRDDGGYNANGNLGGIPINAIKSTR